MEPVTLHDLRQSLRDQQLPYPRGVEKINNPSPLPAGQKPGRKQYVEQFLKDEREKKAKAN